MRYLRARLDQPAVMRHPMQDFLSDSDTVHREEMLTWNAPTSDEHLFLFYVEGDREDYRARIEDVDQIRWYELSPVDEESFYAYVCEDATDAHRALIATFAELELVVVPPVVFDAEGRLTVTAVGRAETLTELVDAIGGADMLGVDVIEVGTYDRRHGGVSGDLTDRQYEAIETAARLGYYDAPREASLAAVATELDVAPATASELLRRAESELMKRVVGID